MPKSDADALYQVPGDYEALLGADGSDLPHYKALAALHGGPLLDLACGTGRVSLALAAEGHRVLGVDASAPMLAAARAAAASRGLAVEWLEADLRGFACPPVRLALLPYNGLQHLHTPRDLAAFFGRLRACLEPGGVFAFDVHLPQPGLLAREPGEWYGVEEGPATPGGWRVLAERSAWDPAAQVLTQTWRLGDADGRQRELVLGLRQFFAQELAALLDVHGFEVLRHEGGFDGRPLGPASLRQVVVCRRRS